MPAFLSIPSERCHRYSANMPAIVGRSPKKALQFGADRDLTPQAAIAQLITFGSMLGRWMAPRHAMQVSYSFQAQHIFGDSKARGTFGEGIK